MKTSFLKANIINKAICCFIKVPILILTSLILLACNYVSYGQGEQNLWAFGYHSGMDFTSGAPVGFLSNVIGYEGTASICDASGQLLFYTNGYTVCNRDHELFPDVANGVVGATSQLLATTPLMPWQGGQATQSAAIAGVPNHLGWYYIFSLGDSGGALYYSIVDMSLHNGKGGIVAGKKGVFVTSGLAGKMTVVKGCNNIWLMVRSLNVNQWKAFEINDNGIETTPVISSLGSLPLSWYRGGVIKFSPDGLKMASASNPGIDKSGGLELYDFNIQTGKLSNLVVLDSSTNLVQYYGACFSPDNSKLYASISSFGYNNSIYFGNVRQFDLSLPTTAAVIASNTVIFTDTTHALRMVGDLKRGKNDKIYFGIGQDNYICPMHSINNPNLAGVACNLQLNAMLLPPYTGTRALPNDIAMLQTPDTIYTHKSVAICFKNSGIIVADSGKRYMWMDGSTNRSLQVNANGTYVVRYINQDCKCEIDSIHVRFVSQPKLSPAGYSCPDKQQGIAWVEAVDTSVFHYQWKRADGTVIQDNYSNYGDTLKNLDTGMYYVQITTLSGCDTTISVLINALPVPSASFNADSIACKGVPVSFTNTSDTDAVSSYWQYGDGNFSDHQNPDYAYSSTGNYTVTLTVTNIEGCTHIIEKEINIKGLELSLTANKELINRGELVRLETSANEPYSIFSWLPTVLFDDQNALSQSRTFDTTQIVSVRGRSAYGCIGVASVKVAVAPSVMMPSAFSPNGDGLNDRFSPNNSGEIFVRHFEVYNRFGQQVFVAFGSSAVQGWDGTFKGQQQDMGVYYYIIDIETKENKTILLKGDVTLLR